MFFGRKKKRKSTHFRWKVKVRFLSQNLYNEETEVLHIPI